MRGLAAKLVDAAADLTSEVVVVVDDDDPRKRDGVAARVEGYLYRIRNNEEMRTFVHRRDEPGRMTMLIGLGDHDEKDAIAKALETRAVSEGGRAGVRVWTREPGDGGPRRTAARRLLRLAGDVAAEEDDESFAQRLKSLRRGLRMIWRNKTKTLKALGVRRPIRPFTTVEQLVGILQQLAGAKPVEARMTVSPSALSRGLMTLRSKRKKRLKNFGIDRAIRPNMKVEQFINQVIVPLIEMSHREEAQRSEQEKAKKETGQVDVGQDAVPAGGFFEPVEKSLPEKAFQSVETKEELYEQAEEAQEEMLDWLDRGSGMDKELGLRNTEYDVEEFKKPGRLLLLAPLKGEDRATQKVNADMGGDWSQLTDVVRASIAVDSIDEIPEVLAELRKSGMKLARKPKDRFANPTDVGYRDILMNVVYPNGHVGELQVHLKPVLVAKDVGHGYYEEAREIEDNAKIEGRTVLTDEEQAVVDEANRKMRALYDRAWKKAIGRTAGMGRKAAGKVMHFMFEDNPAKLVRNEILMVLVGRRFKRLYDFERFHREAEPITEKRYLEELRKRARRSG